MQGQLGMKTFSNKITIVYKWFRDGGEHILPEHLKALEESALNRIWVMIAQDYTAGELSDNIRMTDEDGEDGVEYRGWWEIKQ